MINLAFEEQILNSNADSNLLNLIDCFSADLMNLHFTSTFNSRIITFYPMSFEKGY